MIDAYEKGQNWIRNFLQKILDEETMKEIEQMSSEKNEMDPTAGSKKGSKGFHLYPRFTFCIDFIFPFLICFAATEFETSSFEKRCDV